MAIRDFDTLQCSAQSFKVGGQQFTTRKKVPFKKLSRFIDAANAPDADDVEEAEKFFNLVLIRGDRQRLLDLLDADSDDDADADHVVGLDQVRGIMSWLVEHYTGKAETSSDGFSPGVPAAETGASSNVVSLNPRAQAG